MAGPARRPGRRLAAGIAAAAAVIAIVIAAALVTGPGGPVAPPPAREALQSAPRYDMAIVPSGPVTGGLINQTHAVVRDTVTGRTLATVLPPKPYVTFTWLSGAGDDRTFVLAAQSTVSDSQTQPDKFYEARFSPASDTVTLTPLTLPGLPVSQGMAEVALSPDGTRLAVASYGQITVYALPGGTAKTWTAPNGFMGPGSSINDLLSWSTGGTLAYGSGDAVYLLNTNGPPGQLLPASRQALCLAASVSGAAFASYTGILTPDGTTIIAPVRRSVPIGQRPPPCQTPPGPLPTPGVSGPPALEEFSVTTGQATSIIDTHQPDGITLNGTIYWTNSSGSVLVVEGTTGSFQRMHDFEGIFSGGRFFPIPGFEGSPPLVVQMAF